MKRSNFIVITTACAAFFALSGCATLPTGPSVMVLPPQGKPFAQFQTEDAQCRQWARQSIGMSPQEAANQNTLTGAAVGTAIGAGLGAAIGAASGHAGTGAAIGAGSGLLIGTASGADSGRVYGWEAQRRYDIAYQQCMYAQGNIIPSTMYSAPARRVRRAYPPPPPPGYYYAPSNEVNPEPSPSDSASGAPVVSGPSVPTPPQDFHEVPPDYTEPSTELPADVTR